MRQRNTTPYAWTFAAMPATGDQPEQPGYTVESGGITDRSTLLDGWTAVDDEPEPDKTSAEAAKPRPRKTTSAEDSKGGEPQ